MNFSGNETTTETAATDPENTRGIVKLLQNGPGNIVDWLGNNEIWIGQTMISTDQGKLTVKRGLDQQTAAAIEQPGALNWWRSLPNFVKYGAPIAAAIFLLKK